ncbi:MAG TPA: tetratricopeptide repeat protein [Candidatus Acidoferrales bacterium]|nr:tetratricopeptide repeat protein [Candidatus Acidoferrales bacterium]
MRRPDPMAKILIKTSLCVGFAVLPIAAFGIFSAACGAQASKKVPALGASASARKGIQLASRGHCDEALPLLRKSFTHITDKQLVYHTAMAMAQCGMSVDQEGDAVNALVLLRREFPNDPTVLYTATHFYSELGMRAAQKLIAVNPRSAEAQELNAEALESHGKLNEAIAAYRQILEQYPEQPGIHYRIGRIILAEPPTETSADEAKKEFEAELKIDPSAASAEFMLGDLARQSEQWDQAIEHFGRAAKLDAGFSEAFLGLGISLNAVGKSSEAITPLEKYVKMEPSDPAGHYQLAIAYGRTGRKQDAEREMALQRETEKKAPPATPQNPNQL